MRAIQEHPWSCAVSLPRVIWTGKLYRGAGLGIPLLVLNSAPRHFPELRAQPGAKEQDGGDRGHSPQSWPCLLPETWRCTYRRGSPQTRWEVWSDTSLWCCTRPGPPSFSLPGPEAGSHSPPLSLEGSGPELKVRVAKVERVSSLQRRASPGGSGRETRTRSTGAGSRRPEAHFRSIMAAMAAAARVESPRLLSFSLLGLGKLQGLKRIPDPGKVAPLLLRRQQAGHTFCSPGCPLAGSPAAALSLQRPQTGDWASGWAVREEHGASAAGPGSLTTNPRPRPAAPPPYRHSSPRGRGFKFYRTLTARGAFGYATAWPDRWISQSEGRCV